MKKIEIYTDGSCLGNPGPGGWGAILKFNDSEKVIHGAEKDTTNNRMELKAALEAIKSVKEPCEIDLYTDSNYLRQGITEWMQNWKKNGWKTASRKPVKNVDLWQAIDDVIQSHKIDWHWVKAHNGHTENERVDKIAREAIKEL